nr:hypothetical protein [Tanacetum cinerariifolium]
MHPAGATKPTKRTLLVLRNQPNAPCWCGEEPNAPFCTNFTKPTAPYGIVLGTICTLRRCSGEDAMTESKVAAVGGHNGGLEVLRVVELVLMSNVDGGRRLGWQEMAAAVDRSGGSGGGRDSSVVVIKIVEGGVGGDGCGEVAGIWPEVVGAADAMMESKEAAVGGRNGGLEVRRVLELMSAVDGGRRLGWPEMAAAVDRSSGSEGG